MLRLQASKGREISKLVRRHCSPHSGDHSISNLMDNFDPFWNYHSGIPGPTLSYIAHANNLRFLPLSVPEDLAETFRVSFRTQRFAPNHSVTLRNNVDGWSRDVFGSYRDGEWRFTLEKANYRAGLTFKFLPDKEHWMTGSDLHLDGPQSQTFSEQEVSFSGYSPKFSLNYDNLRVSEDETQQAILHSNYDETIVYDVIIVGSGMGGGILADALTDRGKKTLVLDVGSLDFPTHIMNLPGDWAKIPPRYEVGHYRNEPNSDFLLGAQMNLGGRSLFWSGIIPRMKGWEMQRWPQALRDFLTFGNGYDRAEKLMRKQVTLGPFQDSLVQQLGQRFAGWEVVNTPRAHHQPNLGAPSIIQNSTGVFSSAELLLDSLTTKGRVGRDFLSINLNHLVTRIEHHSGKVSGVVCQDLVGNRERTYKSKYIVLAAGSLESPKIALRSKLSDPNALIGVGLTDHPAYFSKAYDLPENSPFAGKDKHAKVFFYPGTNHRGPKFNVEIVLNGEFWEVRHADDDVWEDQLNAKCATQIRIKFAFSSELDDENFVKLSEGDGSGKLRVKVKRNLSGSGAAEWIAVRDLRNDLCDFFGVDNVPQDDSMHFGNEGTVNHAGGTLRLSEDRSGVVNSELRFEGYENLYCADVSVFPHIPAANPGLTLVALVLRLSDHLVEKLDR
jgi:choline dehydrogenase-like flavoprotein